MRRPARYYSAAAVQEGVQGVASNRSFDEALRVASSALERMRGYQIPPTPENFTVWFHYAGNSYPDLTRAIEVILKSETAVSALDSAGLFERFFANAQDNDTVRDAFQRFEDVMKRAADDLTVAGEGAAAFGTAMADASGALSSEERGAGVLQIVQGIVTAARQMEARSKELEERLEAASSQVTHLKDEVEAMRVEATTDALTGLANRKKFDSTLRESIEEAKETGEPLSLLMLDLDHFKRFNDEHGHLIGDHVLRLLASVVGQCIKGRDTAARFGGEEFAVVLPSTALDNAKNVGNVIREAISKKAIVNRVTGQDLGKITLSIGAAQYRSGEPLTELIERADAALYRAKHAGRNRVMTEAEGETRVAASV
jgi:diguanylate cyclase